MEVFDPNINNHTTRPVCVMHIMYSLPTITLDSPYIYIYTCTGMCIVAGYKLVRCRSVLFDITCLDTALSCHPFEYILFKYHPLKLPFNTAPWNRPLEPPSSILLPLGADWDDRECLSTTEKLVSALECISTRMSSKPHAVFVILVY